MFAIGILMASATMLSGCGEPDWAASEARAIERATTGGDRDGLIEVSIFGGRTFIPNRYVLHWWGEEQAMGFFSPSNDDRMSGHITFVQRNDTTVFVSEHRQMASRIFKAEPTTVREDVGGLCVDRDRYEFDSGPETNTVYVYSSEQAVVIMDDSNPGLPGAILNAYLASVKGADRSTPRFGKCERTGEFPTMEEYLTSSLAEGLGGGVGAVQQGVVRSAAAAVTTEVLLKEAATSDISARPEPSAKGPPKKAPDRDEL